MAPGWHNSISFQANSSRDDQWISSDPDGSILILVFWAMRAHKSLFEQQLNLSGHSWH